jgi:sugar phosphate permease
VLDHAPGRLAENTLQFPPELRRRWVYLLPAVFVTYSLAYLDRANYGFGAAAGMAQSLHISNSRSAFLGSLFFLGYFLFQVPGAAYARRESATRLIFLSLLSWGALAALTGVIREFWLLALDRLLLGVAESLILPAMLILLTNWFTRAERSRANTILILGNPVTVLWMSAVTGYLIKAAGWQMAFVIEGIPSILWAFVWVSVARDQPRQAPWLTQDCCDQLTAQLELEQKTLPRTANFIAALKMPSVLLLCVQYFCWSVGVYGFVLWLPTMIRAGMAHGIEIVGLLSAVPYLLAVILMLLVAKSSDRALTRRRFIWPFLVLSGAALLASFLTAAHSFWLAYAFLILAGGAMYAPYGPFFAIVPEMLPKNVAGEVMALINSCGALGGFVGAWFVGLLQALTGNSRAGYLFMSVSLIAAGAMIFCLRASTPEIQPEI